MKQDIPAGDRPDQTFLPWDSNKLIFQYDPNEIVRNKLLEQNPS